MKKWMIAFGAVLFLVVLTACQSDPLAEIEDGRSKAPEGFIYGEVLEINDRDLQVEVEEAVTGYEFEPGDVIKVQTHNIDLSVYESIRTEDYIEIHYNGEAKGESQKQVSADTIIIWEK